MVHVEPQRSTRHHRRQNVSDDGDVGPSTTQIERDEEYARRLQVCSFGWKIDILP